MKYTTENIKRLVLKIFDETKNFASNGLKHNIPGETRRLRQGLKINTIDF